MPSTLSTLRCRGGGCAGSKPRVADELVAIVAAAAAAVAEARPLQEWEGDEEEEAPWDEYNGARLEPALRVDESLGDSPVKLVDARFLIELAKRGGTLCRRQDLPAAAFISLEALKRMPKGGRALDCLRVIAVSHPWQQPDLPDPKSINLKLLARALKAFLELPDYHNQTGGTYAVFLDFASCFQKGRNGEERTESEAKLFKMARAQSSHSAHTRPMDGVCAQCTHRAVHCVCVCVCAAGALGHDELVRAPEGTHLQAHRAAGGLPGGVHLPPGRDAEHRELL